MKLSTHMMALVLSTSALNLSVGCVTQAHADNFAAGIISGIVGGVISHCLTGGCGPQPAPVVRPSHSPHHEPNSSRSATDGCHSGKKCKTPAQEGATEAHGNKPPIGPTPQPNAGPNSVILITAPVFLPASPAPPKSLEDQASSGLLSVNDNSGRMSVKSVDAVTDAIHAVQAKLIEMGISGERAGFDTIKSMGERSYSEKHLDQLEGVYSEGLSRDAIMTRLMRRVATFLPSFKSEIVKGSDLQTLTLTQLFELSSIVVRQSIMDEQEAAAFSTSFDRLKVALSIKGGSATCCNVSGSDRLAQEIQTVVVPIDAQFDGPRLGLRYKLRARRIVADCLAEDPQRSLNDLISSRDSALQQASTTASIRGTCLERVRQSHLARKIHGGWRM